MSLTDRLRLATRDLHSAAERAGMMGDLLAGRLELSRYVLLLRNLHALYDALERAISASLQHLPLPLAKLQRAPALAADLHRLQAADWSRLPLTSAMQDYVARIRELAASRPELLAAHAYVRYLGDLSGGQILGRVVRRTFALTGESGVQFYAFAGDVAALKEAFRHGLDALPFGIETADAIVSEARTAFALHIRLFEELEGARRQGA